MIVCISGPSSTGKTTLLKELSGYSSLIESIYGGEVIFKEESIRTHLKQYIKSFDEIISNPEEAILLQINIADLMYKSYIEMISNKNTLYICDRSPLDNVVYNLMNYHSDSPEVMVKYSDKLSTACSLMRSMYSYVDRIYLTLVDRNNETNVEDDGFRPKQYNHRRQLEIELFNVIFDFSPKVVKLPSVQNDRITAIFTDFNTLLRR